MPRPRRKCENTKADPNLECAICLSGFEEDMALIPELTCNCILIVHEACWDQWTGICLYCRNIITLEPPINLTRPHYYRIVWVLIAITTFAIYANLIMINIATINLYLKG